MTMIERAETLQLVKGLRDEVRLVRTMHGEGKSAQEVDSAFARLEGLFQSVVQKLEAS